ncbi:hypothetical protein BRC97_00745 [Halobacteriales archaeon QS_6_71_20]|nr:MAG: hypothetical protein BRC97_00745 [Halobacteriales archaeon QS_6_71_20]
MTRRRLAAVLALAVLLAGCAGGLGGDGGGDAGRTVNPALAETPTASPTPTPARDYPLGVTADRVSVGTVSTEHDRVLSGRDSTVRFDRIVVAENGTTLATSRGVIESAGDRLSYRIVTEGSPPDGSGFAAAEFAVWSNRSLTTVRSVNEDGDVRYRVLRGASEEAVETDDSGEGLVYAALVDTEVRLAGTTTVDGETLYVLRAEHDRLDRTIGPPTRNHSVVAYVTEEGVVRSYQVRYTATYETANGSVTATTTEQFRVTLGDTTAAPPTWVGEALRTEGEQSESEE